MGYWGMILVVGVVLLAVQRGEGAAPPLHPGEKSSERLEALEARAAAARQAGDYGEALKRKQEELVLRRQWQGARHWQTIDTTFEVARLRVLSALPHGKQKDLAENERETLRGAIAFLAARFAVAGTAFRKTLVIQQKVLGEDHPETAMGYNNVASVLEAQGKHREAFPLFQKALAIRTKTLGEEHPHTAISYKNLADCLQEQGRTRYALPLYRKALAVQSKVLGEEHPHTAQTYGNLAGCLQKQGKLLEATALNRKALEINRKVFGEGHRETALSSNNIACCLLAQGKAREALPVFRQVLAVYTRDKGKEHPDTATCYNNIASCLKDLGKVEEALSLHEKVVAIRRKVLGEQHPDTATGYNNLAHCLTEMGRAGEALPYHEKALAILKKVLGEEHPHTATSYDNLALCLKAQGRGADALPLHLKALAIRKKTLGERHPGTATSYHNLASCLGGQGKAAEALPLHEKALSICKIVLGEGHPDTAMSYNNLALCLKEQGKAAEAIPHYLAALTICQKVLGENHRFTALCYNNLASCLKTPGRSNEAVALHERALAIHRKLFGEEHTLTAASYNNLANCLQRQGKSNEARSWHEKALAIQLKILGENHPHTAITYSSLAFCLKQEGRAGEALPLFQKALAIKRRVLSEEHPTTSDGYLNLTQCQYELGMLDEAIQTAKKGLVSQEISRVLAASTGFDRAFYRSKHYSLQELLALMLARKNEPAEAWRFLEDSLGRALLDDYAGVTSAEDAVLGRRLSDLDTRLLPLFGRDEASPGLKARREGLFQQRRELLAEAARKSAQRSAGLVWSLGQIQKQVPDDTALVVWVAVKGGSWACLVRQKGDPVWVRLEGGTDGGARPTNVHSLTRALYQAVAEREVPEARRQRLLEEARARFFAPLREHLKATSTLPAVRRLVVVPVDHLARLPVELLTGDHVVSYTPSMTAFAQGRQRHRPLAGTTLLALGDPVFQPQVRPLADLPKSGVFVFQTRPKGMAANAGVEAGDVILEYDKNPLKSFEDMARLRKLGQPAEIVFWRNGERRTARLQPGPLGLGLDRRPVAEAVRAWRETDAPLVRKLPHESLPGTRYEVEALRRLVGGPGTTLLVGSRANDVVLEEMAMADRLKGYRLIHLATHGKIDLAVPRLSALVLSQDRLPSQQETLERATKGLSLHDGMLRVQTIFEKWKLDADLVTLSACETALGPSGRGDGLLGFAHVLMLRGARSVVLSRWKVDDTATALLMLRFYENLLGSRKGTKALPRAEALHEAKRWLSELPRGEAEGLATLLPQGKLTTTSRGSVVVLKTGEKKPTLPQGDRPYTHPSYWAAFTLIGDAE